MKTKKELMAEHAEIRKREEAIAAELLERWRLVWSDDLGWLCIPSDDEEE